MSGINLIRRASAPLRWNTVCNMGRLARGYASGKSSLLSLSYPESLLNVPETRITTLSNGMRVASENSDLDTVTLGIWIDAGSRFEDDSNNGVAHFLEHMAFKGTQRRTQQALELEVENMGGHLNAYTSREQTVYFAQVMKKDTAQAVDIIADILQNATLDANALERERQVILRESVEVYKETQQLVFEHLHSIAYQGTPLARTIIGPESNVLKISVQDCIDYKNKNYTGPRMVMAAAGGVDHDELAKLTEKHFSSIPAKDNIVQSPKSVFTGSELKIRDDTMDAAHVALSFEGCSWTHPDYFALKVVQAIIGSYDRAATGGTNFSSKLAKEMNEQGICNSYTSFSAPYSDTGLFGVYMTMPENKRDRLDDVIHSVQMELVRLCLSANENEVHRAKQQLKAGYLIAMDGTTNICEDIGRQVLTYGRRLSAYETDARIEAVDAKMVREVAHRYLYERDPAVVGVGPIEAMTDYTRIQGNTRWVRS